MKEFRNKFDALVARMQAEEASKGLSAAFRATPEELAEAVKQAMTPRPSVASPLHVDAMNTENIALGKENQPGSVCRVVINILTLWRVSDTQADTLLGLPASGYSIWKTTPPALTSISFEVTTRMSYLLGIYAALQTLFAEAEHADSWVHRENSAPLFGGRCPLDRLLNGRLEDLKAVRQFLDGWCET